MDQLIAELKAKNVLRQPAIEAALRAVDRADFVPVELRASAYLDEALPTAFGQTISQPYTVVFTLAQLGVRPGEQVMDIGSGSGWSSALLAQLVGETGSVYAMELRAELCRFGELNVAKYPALAKRTRFFCQNASSGLPGVAKKIGGFDRIVAAAAVNEVPTAWREQLKVRGRLVYPHDYALVVEDKLSPTDWHKTAYPGFIFVPFVV